MQLQMGQETPGSEKPPTLPKGWVKQDKSARVSVPTSILSTDQSVQTSLDWRKHDNAE